MAIPQRDQQIIQAHASFVCQVVALIQNRDGRAELASVLAQASDSGWAALAAQVRRFANGEREIREPALDDEDRVLANAILRGLQDPSTLPDPQQQADPALAAPGLAHMIHAAGHGDVQALTLVSQMAEQMSRVGGDMSRVASVIRPLINGERDPDRLCERMDTRGQQLVLQILSELGKLDLH